MVNSIRFSTLFLSLALVSLLQVQGAFAQSKPEAFTWNEHSKLSWDDFRGPFNPDDDQVAAVSNCGIGYYVGHDAAGKPEVRAYSKFLTRSSSVDPNYKHPDVLNHEQGHFDISEIYARKLNRLLKGLHPEEDKDANKILQEMFHKIDNAQVKAQIKYEEETVHGTAAQMQKHWDEYIANELVENPSQE